MLPAIPEPSMYSLKVDRTSLSSMAAITYPLLPFPSSQLGCDDACDQALAYSSEFGLGIPTAFLMCISIFAYT